MGSFLGHILPGTLFWIWGFWHLLNIFYNHFKFRSTEKNGNRNERVAFSIGVCCCSYIFPIEGIMKMVLTVIGMSAESFGFVWGSVAMYQHFTMYASFCITGLIDILLFYKFPNPPQIDYCLHMIGFVLEGIMFSFHLHGRSPLDVTVHTLVVIVSFFCALMIIVMMVTKNKLEFRLLFAVGIMIQGSWFWHVGQMLYPKFGKTWCEKCHEIVMLAVMIFSWHVILNILLSILIFMIMSKLIKSKEAEHRYKNLKDEVNDDTEDVTSQLLEMTDKTDNNMDL